MNTVITKETITEPSVGGSYFKSLVAAIQELSLSRNIETVMRIVRTKARELTGADGATFVLRENGMCHYADEDAIGPLWKGQRFPMSTCVSGWAMLNRRPAVIEDIYTDDRIPISAYKPTFVKSLVMVPIRSIEPIGAIGTYWARTRIPTQEEITLLQALADVTAVAMENIQVYNELEQRVKERTLELINSLNREKEMNALKTRFVSIASHEFRTPLGTILSSTSLLENYLGSDIDEKKTKHIGRIKSSIKNLINILNDFLTMEKLEQHKTDLRSEVFNLPEFIREVIGEMEGTLKQGQSIQYTHEGASVIQQDRNVLHNILLNLLSNAGKYSDEGKLIDLHTAIAGEQVTLHVKDQGIGIPEKDQQYIFTDFFRAENTTGIQGTGLGLNIVKRYVELIDGSINFTSNAQEGTTFTLQFKSTVDG